MKKLGLALGGGGSRALCAWGVLQALHEAQIPVSCLAGNSMGGLIAAHYAAFNDPWRGVADFQQVFTGGRFFRPRQGDGLERRRGLLGYLRRSLRAWTIATNLAFRRSFLWRNPCAKAVAHLLKEKKHFADLNLPLAIVALNLTDGEIEVFSQGDLWPPLIAGTNLAVVFPPYQWREKEYCDAAPVCAVPTAQAQALGAAVVLAVDVRSFLPADFRVQNGFDCIMRLEMIASNLLNEQQVAAADITLKPETGNIFWGDFSTIEAVVAAGKRAAQAALPRLRDLLASP